MGKFLKGFIRVLGFGAFLFVVASWLAARWLTSPTQQAVAWPPELRLQHKEVAFQTPDDVMLKGWFLPRPGSSRAVVLLHGLSANRLQLLNRAAWLHEIGFNVLLYDARGCGESAPVARGYGQFETKDLLAAVEWLQTRGMRQIGCIGFSQGAATVLLASSQLPETVRAVVVESSYTYLRDSVDAHFRIFTGLSSHWFGALVVPFAERRLGLDIDSVSPLNAIQKLRTPIYLVGGTADTLAPPDDMRQLYAAASGEKNLWLVDWAGHGDFFSYAEVEYKKRIGDFLNKCVR